MPSTNFERMIQLAVETFAAHNDPEQLDVNDEVIRKLERIHPAAVSERTDGDGPVAWGLMIPTTTALMNQFVAGEISEGELLDKTPLDKKYDALYLCSAMVLPEYRRKGLAKQMAIDAIRRIRAEHPVKNLFTWNFSKEGAILAESISRHESLPLLKRFPNHKADPDTAAK
jgi:ribosomal protein S18 acetylase RimI-like enzyme